MLENSEYFNNLLSWYGKLLTDNQLSIMISYYEEDLSLAEIARNNGVSRSAIHETIKRSQELLEMYEEKLQVYRKFAKRSEKYELLLELNIDIVNEIVEELENIE